MTPDSIESLVSAVRSAERVPIALLGSDGLSFAALKGEIRHDVADGVVSCPSGTSLNELNAALAEQGRCVPFGPVWPPQDLSVAELVLLGLPHALEGRFGTWRDWILGATMVTAEGEIVRSGSRVVKSVAGYDAHKLLIGSRGALILPAEMVFRTFPIPSEGFPHPVQSSVDNVRSILRVRKTDLRSLLVDMGHVVLYVDPSNATLWTSAHVQDLPIVPYSWRLDPYHPEISPELLSLHRRTKLVLDPRGKLAPEAFHTL